MKIEVPLLLLLLLHLSATGATFRFASYYGDHMVLQQKPAHAIVWGYGEVGAQVTVSLVRGMESIFKTAVSVNGDVGIWKVQLAPVAYGGPYQLVAQQTYKGDISSIVLDDILFGDVWLCSGQSNMEMTLSQVFNAKEELAKASLYPYVRLFTAALETSNTELLDLAKVDLDWSIPTAENLGHSDFTYFSAVCWLFGRHLAHHLKYPIGLVESTWGGTPVEAWSSKAALAKCGLSHPPEGPSQRYPELFDVTSGPGDFSVLWNAMIHPLLNMTIKGAIWYQGEQNTGMDTDLYNCTFPALIRDWRRTFHEGSLGQTDPNFPFGFVQLSTYQKSQPKDNYPVIRWHQTADYGYAPNSMMPNTFMAVAMDLGDEKSPYGSVHPRDKQTVAYRLYLGARAIAYGEKDVSFKGPFPVTIDVYYSYSYMNITYDQDLFLNHTCDNIFEVLCRDAWATDEAGHAWVPLSSEFISSSSSNVVTVLLKGCKDVAGVRYAWSDWPCEYKQCPIYGVHGKLPAPLFLKYFSK